MGVPQIIQVMDDHDLVLNPYIYTWTICIYIHIQINLYHLFPTNKPCLMAMFVNSQARFSAEAVPNTPSSTHHWDSWRVTWSESVGHLEHEKMW